MNISLLKGNKKLLSSSSPRWFIEVLLTFVKDTFILDQNPFLQLIKIMESYKNTPYYEH